MASRITLRSTQQTIKELNERLDSLTKLLDRAKVMYEQYFMGIQKVAPSQLHRDIEREVREITQQQIRNTALRFRFTTISQKYGSYNTYWKRTLRQIEQGRYIRDIQRVKRQAEATGQDIPDEILAAMPKRMRDQVARDRRALAKRKGKAGGATGAADDAAESGADATEVAAAEAVDATPERVAQVRSPRNQVHRIDEDALLAESDYDLDKMFASFTADDDVGRPAKPAPNRPVPPRVVATGSTTRGVAPVAPPTPVRRPSPPSLRGTQKAAPPPIPPRPPSAPVRPPPGMSVEQGQKLYRRYVQARKLVGDNVDKLTYDKLMRTLNQQAPQIMRQHQATGVDFNVVIKGKKVILKAKPTKS